MKVLKLTELYVWFLVIIVLPILLPYGLALLINILWHTGKDWLGMFEMILGGGAYIFLSLFVLFSLLPHFFETSQPKINTSIVVVYCLVTVFVLFITCMLYFSFLSLIESENAVPFSKNLSLSIGITIFGILVAIVYKIYFLHQKTNKNNTSNRDVETNLELMKESKEL